MEACLQKSANPHEWLERMEKIVVENGRHFIGHSAIVVVTSVLQTSAGRMIFAKTK